MSWAQIGNDLPGESDNDNFGTKTSINGDGTIVAFPTTKSDDNGTNSGEVEVYQYSDSSWTQLGSDIPGEGANDKLHAIKLNNAGTRIVVGERGNDPDDSGGTSQADGSVKVYDYDSGSDSWSIVGSEINPSPSGQGEQFGLNVSINNAGNRIVIGARYWDDGGSSNINKGYVEIYEYSGGSWSLLGSRIEGPVNGAEFGTCIDINSDGDRVVIGGPSYDTGATNRGIVQIYEYDSGSSDWVQLGSDILGSTNDKIGHDVSINNTGDRILFTSRLASYAQIHSYDGSTWSQLGSTITVSPTDNLLQADLNGDGDVMVIGNWGKSSDTGEVLVYQYTSDWALVGSAIGGESTGDKFGTDVAINNQGEYISIGASINSGGGTARGEGYVYYNSSLAASSGSGGKITVKGSGKMTVKGSGKIIVK